MRRTVKLLRALIAGVALTAGMGAAILAGAGVASANSGTNCTNPYGGPVAGYHLCAQVIGSNRTIGSVKWYVYEEKICGYITEEIVYPGQVLIYGSGAPFCTVPSRGDSGGGASGSETINDTLPVNGSLWVVFTPMPGWSKTALDKPVGFSVY